MSSTQPRKRSLQRLLLCSVLCCATLILAYHTTVPVAHADASNAPCGVGGIDAYSDTSDDSNASNERCSITTTTDQTFNDLIHVRIDRPIVNQPSFTYNVPLLPGDVVTVKDVHGCVQTGGTSFLGEGTWKRYANPDPQNGLPLHGGDDKYFGTITVPFTGVTAQPILYEIDQPLSIPPLSQMGDAAEFVQHQIQSGNPLDLTLGYTDDNYGDNGYWGHDDGENDQCSQDPSAANSGDGGPAYLDLDIKHDGSDTTGGSIPAAAWDLVKDDYDISPNPYDANGLYRNPRWGWQVTNAPAGSGQYTSLCNQIPACLSQPTTYDSPSAFLGFVPALCRPSPLQILPLAGHRNWFDVTYTGTLEWDGHSSPTFGDDDYNLKLYTPHVGTLADGTPISAGGATDQLNRVQLEFNSDETIDNFDYLRWWSQFHGAVDQGDSFAATYVNNHDAVVTGLMGIDEVHGQSEVHPVHALAIREAATPQLRDDTWAIFVRNWGNEGTCSSNDHFLDATTITMKIPRPSGVSASVVPTPFYHTFLNYNAPDSHFSMWTGASGVYLTFNLPPGNQHGLVFGELSLDWTGTQAPVQLPQANKTGSAGSAGSALRQTVSRNLPMAPTLVSDSVSGEQDPEDIMAGIYAQLSPDQQTLDQQLLAALAPASAQQTPSPMQLVISSIPPPAPSHVPTVSQAPDTTFVQLMEDRFRALCAATGGSMPTQPTACSGLNFPPVTTLSTTGGTPGNNGWLVTQVTATLTPHDASGSGIASTQYSFDGQSWQTYTGPFVLPDGAYTLYYRSTANNGKVEEARQHTFKIDTTPPSITITSPTSGPYIVGQTIVADYSCSDATSGVASCTGPVATGSSFPAGALGTHTFTVNAQDNAGNTQSVAVTYSVQYGVQLYYKPPLAANSGSTIPIKLALLAYVNGTLTNVSSSSLRIQALCVVPVGSLSCGASPTIDYQAGTPQYFTYMPKLDQGIGYQFNVQTLKTMLGTYQLLFRVAGEGSGTYHADANATFVLTK
jgi:hypothetical protein